MNASSFKSVWIFLSLWLFLFFYFVFLAKWYGPFVDDWNIMYFLRALDEGKSSWGLWFEKFYGAHIVTISRALFAIEYFLFNGTNIFPKIFALLCMGGSFYIFYINLLNSFSSVSTVRFLLLVGILTTFGSLQLFTFNYTWASLQHPGAIFLSFIALHFLSRSFLANREISITEVLLCLGTAFIGNLFTMIGFFAMLTIFCGLLLYQAPKKIIIITIILLIPSVYFNLPGDIIIYAGSSIESRQTISAHDFLNILGVQEKPFFFHFFLHTLSFMGAVFVSPSPVSMGFGLVVVMFLLTAISQSLLKRHKRIVFFKLSLCLFAGYSVAACLGRYSTGDEHFDRYAPIYSCLLWSAVIVTTYYFRRMGLFFGSIVLILSLIASPAQIHKQLTMHQDHTKADINVVNNSMIHFSYLKSSFVLQLFKFKGDTFHEFQRNKNWGVYRTVPVFDINNLTADHCTAKQTKKFVVSEKKFIEYQLDGWNESQDAYLPYVYALDATGKVIAKGMSLTRSISWLPLFMQPKENIMLYLVMPRTEALSAATLFGGSKNKLCKIQLLTNKN